MKCKTHTSQKGQSLVLVALLMFVFIGLLAVILDGGYGFLQRRAAQTAADAGALAGARELCETGNITLAIDRALEYAVQRNKAQEATASVSDGIVQVEAEITFSTFFGTIFNRPQLLASAIAEAGCFAPGEGEGVIPIAWSCRPWIDESLEPDPEENPADCAMVFNSTYIIMDSESVNKDFYCQDPPNSGEPSDALDCDVDGDDINDVLAGGDRSWLDLDGGGGGAGDMVDWIDGSQVVSLPINVWLTGESGAKESVFQAVDAHVGDTFLVPVFDAYCDGVPGIACPFISPDDEVIEGGGNSQLYYHVITFAAFTVTCVHAPPYGPNPEICPGFKAAGLADNPNTSSTFAIEGYFTREFSSQVSGKPSNGTDAGVYSIYLIR